MVRQDLLRPNYQQTRLVVRISNQTIVCHMVKAFPEGDKTLASASSAELRNYKITFGLKNFSACYLTGLLLGSRVMRQSKLNKIYRGAQDVGMPHLEINLQGQPATFRAILDIGLKASTHGSKIYAALKGVADAGVNVPHSINKFYGFDKKKKSLDSAKLRRRILGEDIATYAAKIKSENPDSHQFSQYPADGNVYPALVSQAIQIIKKNPKRLHIAKKTPSRPFVAAKAKVARKTLEERKADIEAQKTAWQAQLAC